MKGFTTYLRANPQVLILLIICLVLGLGTFIAVLIGIAGSGSTTTDGYSSGVILTPALISASCRRRLAVSARGPAARSPDSNEGW